MTLQPLSALQQLFEAKDTTGTDRYVFSLKRIVLGSLTLEQDRPLSYCILH